MQVGHELQLGVADIEPVDHCHDVARQQEGNERDGHPPVERSLRAVRPA